MAGNQSLKMTMKEDESKSFVVQKNQQGHLEAESLMQTDDEYAAHKFQVKIQQDTFVESQYQVLLEDKAEPSKRSIVLVLDKQAYLESQQMTSQESKAGN